MTIEELRQYLHEHFRYDEESGHLIYTKKVANRTEVGDIAGSINACGYRATTIKGVHYYIHHLIWVFHFGSWPDELDHIDRNPSNNRIENLRLTNKIQQQFNRDANSNNVSGIRGVAYYPDRNKPYRVELQYKGVKSPTRSFYTADEAKKYAEAEYKRIEGILYGTGTSD